jgi:hypothetical protein
MTPLPPQTPPYEPTPENVEAIVNATLPVEVYIATTDYEVTGYVHVDKQTKPSRQLTQLLNGKQQTFLAVTDAMLTPKESKVTTSIYYEFIHINIASIVMLHPSQPAKLRQQQVSPAMRGQLNKLRQQWTSLEDSLP